MKEQTITVDLQDRAYDITILPGLIKNCGEILKPHVCDRKCFIISDNNVSKLYGNHLAEQVKNAGGILCGEHVFPFGEKSKTLLIVVQIYHAMLKAGLDRDSVIIALGGGVVGDIAGFVAATYMRGIDFIQVPTTLLAMVDSSVGGKTGVDLPEGKNIIGAFWQPRAVLIDPEILSTLPHREIKGGLAEIIKYGVILDSAFFNKLNSNVQKINSLDIEFYSEIIARSCSLKTEVVENDERETGIRAILNYGHTFGHAIETLTAYGCFIHGEAVAIGMLMAGELACSLNIFDRSEFKKIESLCTKLDLQVSASGLGADTIYQTMHKDKKVKNGKLRFILPQNIGKVSIVTDIDKNLVIKAIKKYTVTAHGIL